MSGKTAAMIAASNGNTEILKALGRGPSLLNLKDADGGTAAMTAAVHHHGTVLDYVSSSPPPPIPRVSRSIAPPRAMLPPDVRAPPARLRRPRSVTAESDSQIAKPENQILTLDPSPTNQPFTRSSSRSTSTSTRWTATAGPRSCTPSPSATRCAWRSSSKPAPTRP